MSDRPTPLLRPNMPELDTVRGIAILGVLALHGFYSRYSSLRGWSRPAHVFLELTRWGWVGVNLFFVLSGFLITGILLDSRPRADYYRRFYLRRALRILPAYYALVILLAVLRQSTAAYLGLSAAYLANVTIFFGVAESYGPLWSLAVEEHFYLLWPMIVRWLNRRNLALFAFGVCVAEPAIRAFAFHRGQVAGLASFTWFVADGLASGGLLAILLRTSLARRQIARIAMSLLALAFIAAAMGAPFGILTRNCLLGAALQHTVINIFFSGVLLCFLLAGTAPWGSFIGNMTLRFMGRISYGLYLVHLLVFRLYDKLCARFAPWLLPHNGELSKMILGFIVAAGFATAIACLSRRFYEEPFLRLKTHWTNDGRKSERWTAAAKDVAPVFTIEDLATRADVVRSA